MTATNDYIWIKVMRYGTTIWEKPLPTHYTFHRHTWESKEESNQPRIAWEWCAAMSWSSSRVADSFRLQGPADGRPLFSCSYHLQFAAVFISFMAILYTHASHSSVFSLKMARRPLNKNPRLYVCWLHTGSHSAIYGTITSRWNAV